MFGWTIIAIVAIVAGLILFACERPGRRRRKQDPSFGGPDRREDKTVVDFFDYPMFVSTRCKDCTQVQVRRGCKLPEECNLDEVQHEISKDRL